MYIYRPDNGDLSADVQVPEYFKESRFSHDWVDSIITIDVDDAYIVAKIKDLGSLEVLFDSSTSGGSTPDLQQVTVTGNTTDQAIVFNDQNGEQAGYTVGDEVFGLGLVGRNPAEENLPVTIVGSSALISAETLGIKFPNAATGNFLRLNAEYDINGEQIFSIGTTPLDVNQYSEDFTNTNEIALNTSFQDVVTGVLVNTYQAQTSQAFGSGVLVNTSNQTVTVEVYVTVNDGAPAGDDIKTITVPRKSGSVNGEQPLNVEDTSSTLVNPGDTLQLKIRTTSGSVTLAGSQRQNELGIVQNADIQNLLQNVENVTSNSILERNTYYNGEIDELVLMVADEQS